MSNNVEAQNYETLTETALIEGRRAFLGFLAKRLGNRADAEDVLQEFCLRVLARKDQLRNVERMDDAARVHEALALPLPRQSSIVGRGAQIQNINIFLTLLTSAIFIILANGFLS